VEGFKHRYHTVSCAKMTNGFDDFSSLPRIEHCMEIIAFTTREVACLLFDSDETFSEPEKETYFARREFQ
jgi:hypothetical protein